MSERIFAIGDIHGHANELQELLLLLEEQAGFDIEKDHLVLCGDLVDSGPDSKKVVTWAILNKLKYPDTFHPLKGNHDEMMVDALLRKGKKYDPKWWIDNYGAPTLASYAEEIKATSPLKAVDDLPSYDLTINIPTEHLHFLDNLPLYWMPEDSSYFFVHGGIPPLPLSEIDFDDPEVQDALLWIRNDFYNSDIDFGRKIIFGHSAFPDYTNILHEKERYAPLIKDNMIGINTMPRNMGHLTAVELPAEKFYHVEEKEIPQSEDKSFVTVEEKA